MSKFIDDSDGRVSFENPLEVHLFECDASILDSAQRHAFQIADHGLRILTSMRFHNRNNDVHTLVFEQMSILQHLISLTDTGSCTNVNAQFCLLAFTEPGEKRFG